MRKHVVVVLTSCAVVLILGGAVAMGHSGGSTRASRPHAGPVRATRDRLMRPHVALLKRRPLARQASAAQTAAEAVFAAGTNPGFDLANARLGDSLPDGTAVLAVPGTGNLAGQTCVMALSPLKAGPGVPAALVGKDAAETACASNASFSMRGVEEGIGSGFVGVVPDGVSAVTLVEQNGSRVTQHVDSNTFAFATSSAVAVDLTSSTGTITVQAGSKP
jgi:hypothetical protein